MNLRKIKQDTLRFIGNYVLYHLVNILCLTLRINFANKSAIDELEKQNKNFILGFWHGTMLLPWYLNRDKVGLIRHWPSSGTYLVLSQAPLLGSVAAALKKYQRWVG